MSTSVNVRGILLREEKDPTNTQVRLEIWPLPNEDDLHREIFHACRNAVSEILVRRGISDGIQTDLSAKGPMQ